MASVKKRGNSYQITVSNGYSSDGSKIIETATYTPEPGLTEKKIQKTLDEFRIDFERKVKNGYSAKAERTTVKELSEKFLADMLSDIEDKTDTALSRTTYSGYKQTINNRIIPCLGHITIGGITKPVLNDYAKAMRVDGIRLDGKEGRYSESTIMKDLALVSSMLSYAVDEGYLSMNILLYSGKRKRSKKAKKEYKVTNFTIEETIRFIDALEMSVQVPHKTHRRKDDTGIAYEVPEYTQLFEVALKWKLFFYVALFSGDRRGENVSLTWNDFNFDDNSIEIGKSTIYAERKTYTQDTKTHTTRKNTLPQYVIDLAKQLKQEQIELCFKLGDAWEGERGKKFNENFVFIQSTGKQMHICSPYTEFKRIIRIYNTCVAEADKKIPENVTMHGLRHTAAALLISKNMDPQTVAGVLGHADPTTTLNIYSYFFKSKGVEAANVMEETLLKKQTVAK